MVISSLRTLQSTKFLAILLLVAMGSAGFALAADETPPLDAAKSTAEPRTAAPAAPVPSSSPRPAANRSQTARPAGTLPKPEEIERWIVDLDNDSYTIRQAATRRLSEGGMTVIDPLKVCAANGSLEASTRALSALEAIFLRIDSESFEQATAAEDALEEVVRAANRSASMSAEQILTSNDHVRQTRAVAKIRELGGVVEFVREDTRNFVRPGADDERAVAYVAIPPEWRGGDAALKYLRRIRSLQFVYRIIGNQVSDKGMNELKAALPDLQIQVRGASTLGIEADRTNELCLVSNVKAGLAADKAGLKAGDVIKSFDGKPVSDFESLVELIKQTRPGQKVEVAIVRDIKPMTLQVEMGTWAELKP